ncbi:galaxin isoform X2 [Myripristis murdjan]|nr:galaxin-like isoform X2 [Myripristis murdjan]
MKLCCGLMGKDIILPKKTKEDKCCGDVTYNPIKECCCDSLLVEDRNCSKCCEEDRVRPPPNMTEPGYNTTSHICCGSTLSLKLGPNTKCCGQEAYDADKKLCCGVKGKDIILPKKTKEKCCGNVTYNPIKECCCFRDSLHVETRNCSKCCEEDPVRPPPDMIEPGYNTTSHICCDSTLSLKLWPNAKCCGQEAYDADMKLCCGLMGKERILTKKTKEDKCCGNVTYNPSIQCCCFRDSLHVETRGCTKCCEEDPAVPPDMTETGYNTTSHICCDSTLSLKLWPNAKCCGQDKKDGERGSVDGKPHHPANPHSEICCSGYSYPRAENTQCYGVQAYNISNPQMRCCAGMLYNLSTVGSTGGELQCCGSILMSKTSGNAQGLPKVCCMSQDLELLYTEQPGFSCCGHHYYNTSLWSCCAGRLSPTNKSRGRASGASKVPRLISVDNLNKTTLCTKLRLGTVESVSIENNMATVVFSSVFEIYVTNGTMTVLPSHHVLNVTDHCGALPLICGNTYLWDEVNLHFLTRCNFHSPFQLLHFILSRCHLS